ncbi:alanine racemase [Gracilimonas halophila]|uniref:Alanine racemase n=1 Tax=Gracilimonas halophila TaxID=1834464 RepID=A0ABW5JH44_9BACT
MSSTLYVHLSRIAKNLDAVDQRIGKGVKRMAVVKDEAYGHGLLPVAGYLKDKVEWFCTARLEEAVQLREHGIQNPILVFEIPPAGQEALFLKYDITASISDVSVFERLKPGTKAHLHFDTGMFRLGMLPDDVAAVLQNMKDFDLDYTGIYTHFANSDVEGHSRVLRQLEVFRSIRSQFPEQLLTHTANSGAIFYYHDKGVLFDAVRPGVCLYGYAPGPYDISDLEPVIEWRSKLVQVKKLQKGDLVGYGSRWEAPKEGWLGVIPVGYADGIFRNLSGEFAVEINGQLFQQVGTISMDYVMVYLKEQQFKPGESVTILKNGKLSAKKWAKIMGTIPYEITTAISPKIERVYV